MTTKEKNRDELTLGYHKPQVLLLGNGLNLAYGGKSWADLLKDINVREDFNVKELCSPMPLQAILVTNNNLKETMKKKSLEFFGRIQTDEQMQILRLLLTMGFDDIITTNYSYELEAAGIGKQEVEEGQVRRMMRSKGRAETKYMLHTFNQVCCGEYTNRIWHIHGESRKPDSMILGHYWYGNMLSKMHEELKHNRQNQYYEHQRDGSAIIYDSWLDSFIMGDVYVIGFGFDVSEVDLWWLLNRKYREKAETGRVYFYEMINHDNRVREKIELLRLMNVEIDNFGMEKPDKENPRKTEIYRNFYTRALEAIRQKMNQN